MTAGEGGRLERALAQVSDAPLRGGNRLALLKNGPETYEDWLAAIDKCPRESPERSSSTAER